MYLDCGPKELRLVSQESLKSKDIVDGLRETHTSRCGLIDELAGRPDNDSPFGLEILS